MFKNPHLDDPRTETVLWCTDGEDCPDGLGLPSIIKEVFLARRCPYHEEQEECNLSGDNESAAPDIHPGVYYNQGWVEASSCSYCLGEFSPYMFAFQIRDILYNNSVPTLGLVCPECWTIDLVYEPVNGDRQT